MDLHYIGLLVSARLSMDSMVNELCIKRNFDIKLSSQLLYSAEVWGFRSYDCLQRIQNYACKRYMNVNQKAFNDAVLRNCNRSFPITYKDCQMGNKILVKNSENEFR